MVKAHRVFQEGQCLKRKKRTDWNYTRDTLLWNNNYIMANVRRNNERYECVCVWGRDIISELVVVSKWACSPACVFGFLWSGKAPQSMQRIWNWAGGNELWTFWAGSHSLLWHSASNTQTWGDMYSYNGTMVLFIISTTPKIIHISFIPLPN